MEWVNSVVQSAQRLVDQVKDFKPEPVPPGQQTLLSLALPVVRPLAITGLALYPGTREIRLSIWIGCLAILAWGLLFDALPEVILWPTIFGALGPGTIWAWSAEPPTYHPLPEDTAFNWIRGTTAFKAINLAMNYRLIGIKEPVTPIARSHFRALVYHAIPALFAPMLNDILSYHFLRAILKFPAGTGYHAVRDALAVEYGVPALAIEAGYGVMLALESWLGIQGIWHAVAFVGNLSGFWIDAEFPDITDKPWMASSLNSLWGRRYHQLLRETLKCWTYPIRTLLPILHTPSIFLASAILHSITYSAITHTLVFREFLWMFGLACLGCTLEALFRRYTGHRVHGPLGWIWTWSWMLLLILPQMTRLWWVPGAEEYFRGRWIAQVRGSIYPMLSSAIFGTGTR